MKGPGFSARVLEHDASSQRSSLSELSATELGGLIDFKVSY